MLSTSSLWRLNIPVNKNCFNNPRILIYMPIFDTPPIEILLSSLSKFVTTPWRLNYAISTMYSIGCCCRAIMSDCWVVVQSVGTYVCHMFLKDKQESCNSVARIGALVNLRVMSSFLCISVVYIPLSLKSFQIL